MMKLRRFFGNILFSTKRNHRIVKVNDKEYHLLCSVCGKVAAVFRYYKDYEGKDHLEYDGITGRSCNLMDNAKVLFPLLDKNKLSEAQNLLYNNEKYTTYGMRGMDAYCPDCDKIYCGTDYRSYEERDEDGFYSCTYGTCPKGHTRIIGD